MRYLLTLFMIVFLACPLYGQNKITLRAGRSINFDYQEAEIFTDSVKIIYKKNFIQFKPLFGDPVPAQSFGNQKRYIGTLIDVIREKKGNRVKETIIFKSDLAPKTVKFLVKTKQKLIREGYGISIEDIGYIENPVAWDANSKEIEVSMILKEDTLSYTWKKPDSLAVLAYPVYVDPTVIITEQGEMEDNYIDQGSPTGNNGTAINLHMKGNTADRRTVLIWFDIPYDTVKSSEHKIVSANLILTTSQANFGGALEAEIWNLHSDSSRFHETQSTYNLRATGKPWNTAGVLGADQDYHSSPSTAFSIPNHGAADKYDTLDVTTLSRKFMGQDSVQPFLGFVIRGTDNDNDQVYWASSENTTVAYRPRFEIEYDDFYTGKCSLAFGDTNAVSVILDSAYGAYSGLTRITLWNTSWAKYYYPTTNGIILQDGSDSTAISDWSGVVLPLKSNTDNYIRVISWSLGTPKDTTWFHQQVGAVISGLSFSDFDSLYFRMYDKANRRYKLVLPESLLNWIPIEDYCGTDYYAFSMPESRYATILIPPTERDYTYIWKEEDTSTQDGKTGA